MEWKHEMGFIEGDVELILGNFLSGMETHRRHEYPYWVSPLETSLVEWKLRKNAAEKAPWLPWKLP